MDIVKAFAIIAVVVGHSGSPLTDIIYLYHMPLFFFISGYFYKDNYSTDPFLLLKKRLKTLYVPFVGYELLFLTLHNVLYKLNIYSDQVGYNGIVSHLYTQNEFIINSLKILEFRGTEQLAGAFWFIVILFFVNVFFVTISYFTTKCIKENHEQFRFFIVFLAFIIGSLASYYNYKFYYNLTVSLVALLIYYIGYIYRKHEAKISFNKYFFIISVLFILISSLYGSVDMVSNSYRSPSFLIATSIAGIYFNIYVAKLIMSKNRNHKILDYIGKNTFNIMALHFLSFKLINFIQLKLYNFPIYMIAKFPVIDGSRGWWILYSLCGVFIPILVKYAIEGFKGEIRYLNHYVNDLR